MLFDVQWTNEREERQNTRIGIERASWSSSSSVRFGLGSGDNDFLGCAVAMAVAACLWPGWGWLAGWLAALRCDVVAYWILRWWAMEVMLKKLTQGRKSVGVGCLHVRSQSSCCCVSAVVDYCLDWSIRLRCKPTVWYLFLCLWLFSRIHKNETHELFFRFSFITCFEDISLVTLRFCSF